MALEYQRYGRNKNTLINKSYIDGGSYRKKYDKLTDNAEVNKALYDSAKAALKHRSGTLFEDMYWIDGDSGQEIYSVTNSTKEQTIVYTEKIQIVLKTNKNIRMIDIFYLIFPKNTIRYAKAFHIFSYSFCSISSGTIILACSDDNTARECCMPLAFNSNSRRCS